MIMIGRAGQGRGRGNAVAMVNGRDGVSVGARTDRDLPGLARRVVDAFAESAARRRDRDSLMDTAFARLFDLYQATSAAERGSPAGRDLNATLAELLVGGSNPDRVGLYVVRTQTAADHGRHEGYRPACWRRSMLQILGDEFVPWERFMRPGDIEAIPRIDEALAAVAEEASLAEVPAWVPETHWWWWEPARLRAEADRGPEASTEGPPPPRAGEGAETTVAERLPKASIGRLLRRIPRSGNAFDPPHGGGPQKGHQAAHGVQDGVAAQVHHDRSGQGGGDHLRSDPGDVDDPQVLGAS